MVLSSVFPWLRDTPITTSRPSHLQIHYKPPKTSRFKTTYVVIARSSSFMAFSVETSSLFPYPLSANPKKVSQNTLIPFFVKPCLQPHVSKTLGFSVSRRIRPLSPVFSSLTQVANEDGEDKLHEECGVVGIYGDPEASRLSYLALHALQHRGQEGAGIVTVNQNGLESITGVGLVSDVFTESKLNSLPGDIAIGHVRYSTSGASMLKNVQPFIASCKLGSLAVAHNGNFVNYKQLKTELEEKGSIFITSSDTELVLHLIAKSKAKTFLLRIIDACEKLRGAYSMVFVFEDKLIAVRDPFGFRPLVMGRRSNGAVVFASETCALDLIDASYEREVCPGEIVVVDRDDGDSSVFMIPHPEPKQCVFEHGYFSQPNSIVFGRSVYETRHMYGEILATVAPVDCDVVIAVPDSGTVAALGYAAKAGVPFQIGLLRSHYAKRTFIEPTQNIRDFAVKTKLSPVRAVLEGKRVVVVDDSIVRGTTSMKIVRRLRDAGAKEVHMRIALPPMIASCYYGVDTPRSQELISSKMSVEEIQKYINCDSLAFLPLNSLKQVYGPVESHSYCYACFTSKYPLTATETEDKITERDSTLSEL